MAFYKTLLGLAAGTVFAVSGAFAQSYPERQINMVVPFSAGGPTDTVARLIAEKMSADLGQQIVVENVGGAGGTLGAGKVATAEPDGYTVLLHHIGMATSATLYRKLAYDPLNAFEYVGLVTEVPMTIVARKDFPPGDFKSFMDHVKANAATVTMANAGIGAASHLCGMMFMSAIEAQLTTVPYKGTGALMSDLIGGHIDLSFPTLPAGHPLVQSGKLRALGVTSLKRSPAYPEIPTISESGVPGFETVGWYGIVTEEQANDTLKVRVKSTTGTLTLRAVFANPADLLRPGMTGRVRVVYEVAKEAIVIPQKAVSELLGRAFVSVVLADGKVEQRPVVTGDRIGDQWLIREGLKPGDTVIVEGLQKARPGSIVKPMPLAAAKK